MIQPLNDYLQIEPEIVEETKSGIILSKQDKELRGKVLATCEDSNISVGDTVLYYGRMVEVELEGKKIYFLKEDDLIAIYGSKK